MRDALKALWDEAAPLCKGDPVDEYLRSCGIRLNRFPSNMRWHAPKSCMLAQVVGADGEPVTLHMTKLEEAHRAGISEEPPEAALAGSPGYGYAVRIGPAQSHLAVAVSIESALAVCKRLKRSCWALLDYANMVHWLPPESVEDVRIFGDVSGDHEGQAAAHGLACRLTGIGVTSMVDFPSIPAWPEVGGAYTWVEHFKEDFMAEEDAA